LRESADGSACDSNRRAEKRVVEEIPQRRGVAIGGALRGAVGVKEPASDGADGAVAAKELDHGVKGFGVGFAIGVQQQEIVSTRAIESLAGSHGESEVFGIPEEADPGEFALNDLWGSVSGGIVDEDEFEGNIEPAAAAFDGFEVSAHEIPPVPGHSDNGEG
jgi:hypothetical protein